MNNQNSKMQAIEKDLFKSNENPFFRRFIAAALSLCIILLMCGCNVVTTEMEDNTDTDSENEEVSKIIDTSSKIVSSKKTTTSQKKTTTSQKKTTTNKTTTQKSTTKKSTTTKTSTVSGTIEKPSVDVTEKNTIQSFEFGIYGIDDSIYAIFSDDVLYLFEKKEFGFDDEIFYFSKENDRIKSYSSADTSVATVSKDGTVKGVKPGTTTVTITTEGGAALKITVKILKSVKNSLTARVGSTLPFILDDGYRKYSLYSCDLRLYDYIDPDTFEAKVYCQLDITGRKTYDYWGNYQASHPSMYLIVRRNGVNVGSEWLYYDNAVLTGDTFTYNYECTLTPGNDYSLEFAQD